MKINKKRIISIVLIAIVIMFLMSVSVLAVNPDVYKPNSIVMDDNDEFLSKAGTIVGLVQNIGFMVAVIVLTGIGIKYMFTSIEGRAEYKKAMIPYVVGCFLLVGTSGLISMIDKEFYSMDNVSGWDELDSALQSGYIIASEMDANTLKNAYAKRYNIENKVWENAKNGRDYTYGLEKFEIDIYKECINDGLLQENEVFLESSYRTMARLSNSGNILDCDKCGEEYLNAEHMEGGSINPLICLEWFLDNQGSLCSDCAEENFDDEAEILALVVDGRVITGVDAEIINKYATDEEILKYLRSGKINVSDVSDENMSALYKYYDELNISAEIEKRIAEGAGCGRYTIIYRELNGVSEYAEFYKRCSSYYSNNKQEGKGFQSNYIYTINSNHTAAIYNKPSTEEDDAEQDVSGEQIKEDLSLKCGRCGHEIYTNLEEEMCNELYDGYSDTNKWKCSECKAEIRMIIYSDGVVMRNRYYDYRFDV